MGRSVTLESPATYALPAASRAIATPPVERRLVKQLLQQPHATAPPEMVPEYTILSPAGFSLVMNAA